MYIYLESEVICLKDRIKQARKHFGLTQAAFGEKIKVKGNTVTSWETGTRTPTDAIINSICREFGISENWLRYGTGEMNAEATQKEKLTRFFADVLATAPDERSAFIAALAELPIEFWPLVTELAKNFTANITKKEED